MYVDTSETEGDASAKDVWEPDEAEPAALKKGGRAGHKKSARPLPPEDMSEGDMDDAATRRILACVALLLLPCNPGSIGRREHLVKRVYKYPWLPGLLCTRTQPHDSLTESIIMIQGMYQCHWQPSLHHLMHGKVMLDTQANTIPTVQGGAQKGGVG